jgi:hypothetical protein
MDIIFGILLTVGGIGVVALILGMAYDVWRMALRDRL